MKLNWFNRHKREYDSRLLPTEFWDAFSDVLQYLCDSEQDDYFERPRSQRKGHIFESYLVLDKWFAKLLAEWREQEANK